MEFLKSVFAKVGTGFLYGIGFGVVIGLFIFGMDKYYENKSDELINGSSDPASCRSYKKCEKDAGLSVTISSDRIDMEDFILLGGIKNDGQIKWTSVKVKAELFDDKNNFIDECIESVDEKVFPGESINFKLSCTKCSKLSLDKYSSYKVKIIDAGTY